MVVAEDIVEVNESIYASPEMIKNIRYQICDYTAVEKNGDQLRGGRDHLRTGQPGVGVNS